MADVSLARCEECKIVDAVTLYQQNDDPVRALCLECVTCQIRVAPLRGFELAVIARTPPPKVEQESLFPPVPNDHHTDSLGGMDKDLPIVG